MSGFGDSDFVGFLTLALKILTDRLLALLALAMTFGLYCWALWAHTWISFAAAAAFGVTIFLPVLYRARGGSKHEND